MFIFTFIGTILGTLIGGLLGLYSQKLPKKLLSFLQNFSLGAIISFIFLELFNHAFEHSINYFDNNSLLGISISLLIILISGVLFFILHELVHLFSHHHHDDKDDDKPCHDHAHSLELVNENKSLLITCFIYLGAVFVHNIPEGLSLGFSFINLDNSFPIEGVIVSLVLFIHNLIIGFSMCSSFLHANKSKKYSLLMTLTSSLPAFILAIVGYFISTISINDLFIAILMSISCGSLLYVLFIELLPQTFLEYKDRYSFIYIILGFTLVGILLCI